MQVYVLTLDQWEKMVGNYTRVHFSLTTLFVLLKFSDGWALPDYLPTVRNIDGNHERNYSVLSTPRLCLFCCVVTVFT